MTYDKITFPDIKQTSDMPPLEKMLEGESLIKSLAEGLANHIEEIERDGKGPIKIVFE